MAQNNHLLIGIIVVVVIGVGIYLFVQNKGPIITPPVNPNPPPIDHFSAVSKELTTTLNNHGVFSYTNFAAFSEILTLSPEQLDALSNELNTTGIQPSTPEAALMDILQNTISTGQKWNTFRLGATQIDQLSADSYCQNLALFQARDQLSAEVLSGMQSIQQKINQFDSTYHTQSEQLGLTGFVLDFTSFSSNHELRIQSTQELTQACEEA